MKKTLDPGTSLAPVPVVMVTCGSMEDSNITTIAWTGVINSEPPMVYVSIRESRKSYEIIEKTREFVINIPDKNLVWETDFCGTKSGKNIDKFKETKLTKIKAQNIDVPLIKECPINLECKVTEIKKLGSHDMFIAEVIAVNCDEEFISENGKIDFKNANLLTYAGNKYLAQNVEVGERGICLK